MYQSFIYVYLYLICKKKLEEINDRHFGYNNTYFECVVDWPAVARLKCLLFSYAEEFRADLFRLLGPPWICPLVHCLVSRERHSLYLTIFTASLSYSQYCQGYIDVFCNLIVHSSFFQPGECLNNFNFM